MRPSLVTLLVALVLSGCGGSDQDGGDVGGAREAEVEHVHGLGVDPVDGALLVATHRGLFRVASGSEAATHVGDRTPDLMGFTVVGPGHYLASGHPDPRDDLLSHLGLMESRDGGRSWEPVSLHGEADFHLLETRGGVVYGGDAAGGRFLRSEDRGRTWTPATLPGPTVDIALDPAAEGRLVAATEDGLFASGDAARSWARVGSATGLLAWPKPDLLLVVAGDGTVSRSADGGRTVRRVGAVDGQPEAIASSGSTVYVSLHEGVVVESRDGGGTWSSRVRLRRSS
jgi:photosystem II stability/assembly factor-like uncharacterized protein